MDEKTCIKCGELETDIEGVCNICRKCSLCCQCGTFKESSNE